MELSPITRPGAARTTVAHARFRGDGARTRRRSATSRRSRHVLGAERNLEPPKRSMGAGPDSQPVGVDRSGRRASERRHRSFAVPDSVGRRGKRRRRLDGSPRARLLTVVDLPGNHSATAAAPRRVHPRVPRAAPPVGTPRRLSTIECDANLGKVIARLGIIDKSAESQEPGVPCCTIA